MADERKLFLADFVREIEKVQKELNATEHFEVSAVGLHNGLTLAKSIAYKLASAED